MTNIDYFRIVFAQFGTVMTNKSFVLYHLPNVAGFVSLSYPNGQRSGGNPSINLEGPQPISIGNLSDAVGQQGFLFAPFVASSSTPILFFPGQPISHDLAELPNSLPPAHIVQPIASPSAVRAQERELYHHTFSAVHQHVASAHVAKIVLCRQTTLLGPSAQYALAYFHRAVALNPALFVALIVLPNGQAWLMATPELLLHANGEQMSTMALAGTMKIETEAHPLWSQKNTDEHNVVADYIANVLEPYAANIQREGPLTINAGVVMHLQTRFTFSSKPNITFAHVAQALHPTPAVCGLPKAETLNIIQSLEPTPRLYYSGFAGPISPTEQNLFVSLRCMRLKSNQATLFAGGGIMPQSVEQEEWDETEAKLSTMRQTLNVFA